MTSEPDFRYWEPVARKGLLEAIQRLVPAVKGIGARVVRTTLVTDYSVSQRYLVVDGWVERPEGGLPRWPKYADIELESSRVMLTATALLMENPLGET